MDAEKEISFFDHFEEEHGDYDVLGEGAYRRLLDLVIELAKPAPGERCVDLGCGSGAFTRRLAAGGLRVMGADISFRSIVRARIEGRSNSYLVGDITRAPMKDGSFDVVLYSGVLHHCDQADVRVAVLREGFRLLRPGGRLFAYDPSVHSPSMWLYRDPRSPLFSKVGKTENEVLLSREQLRHEIGQAGFREIEIRGTGGITFRWVEGPIARRLLPLYNIYERVLRLSPFENRFGTFLISFARK